jgi:hypothetical protein
MEARQMYGRQFGLVGIRPLSREAVPLANDPTPHAALAFLMAPISIQNDAWLS